MGRRTRRKPNKGWGNRNTKKKGDRNRLKKLLPYNVWDIYVRKVVRKTRTFKNLKSLLKWNKDYHQDEMKVSCISGTLYLTDK